MADRRDSKNRKLSKGEYQKKDGRYAYRYVDCNGVERWVYSWRLTATDRGEGKCLRDLEADILRQLTEKIDGFTADRTTLNEYFEHYLETKTKLKDQTRARYKQNWKIHMSESIGKRTLGSIKYSDILKFLNGLVDKKGLCIDVTRNLYNLIRPVFALAVRDDLIRKNPADGAMAEVMKSHSNKKKKRHALTKSQQDAFVLYLKGDPKTRKWYRLIVFLLGTGCRMGEARGLTWDDCDFERGLIFVRRQTQYYKGDDEETYSEHLTSTKTESGERVIPMLDAVREVLIEEREWQSAMGWVAKSLDGVSGFIFRTKTGGCLDNQSVDAAIKRLIKKYNESDERSVVLPEFSVHNLRHTFCTRLCENETNLKLIQEIMGHADISTTMNIYNEAMEDVKVQSFHGLEGKIIPNFYQK